MPLENPFPCFLTFLASFARVIPTHLLILNILVCLLFIAYLQKLSPSRCQNNTNCFYRHMLTTVLTWQSSCIVVKYIQKNIEYMLSKPYHIGTYSIVHNVIKYTQNIASVHTTCASGCFGDVKAEGASLSSPPFIIFLPFYNLNEEKGR